MQDLSSAVDLLSPLENLCHTDSPLSFYLEIQSNYRPPPGRAQGYAFSRRSRKVPTAGGRTPRRDASFGVKIVDEGELMVHETIQGTFRQTNLTNESPEYLAKREELRLAEIDLMRQRERVAGLRRHLPPGPALEDYKFIEGPVDLDSGDTPKRTVRLSELFTTADRPLDRRRPAAMQVRSAPSYRFHNWY